MTEDEFWDHIRASGPGPANPYGQTDRLVARLATLPPEQCLAFHHRWIDASHRAYRRDLWDAATLINGGCSDDGFQYFRWWLILQGREVYRAALADPDTLADVTGGRDDLEAEVGPGIDAWFQATGNTRDDAGWAAYDRALAAYRATAAWLPATRPTLVRDPQEDEDEHVRFPRLAAMYLGEDD